jgi:hypothetical protein
MHGLMQSGPSMGMPQMVMPGMDPVYYPSPTLPLLFLYSSSTLPQPFPYPSPTLPLPFLYSSCTLFQPFAYLHLPFPSSVISYRIPTTTRMRERKCERERNRDRFWIHRHTQWCVRVRVRVRVRACVCVHGTCQLLFSLSRLPYTGIHRFRMCPPSFCIRR